MFHDALHIKKKLYEVGADGPAYSLEQKQRSRQKSALHCSEAFNKNPTDICDDDRQSATKNSIAHHVYVIFLLEKTIGHLF